MTITNNIYDFDQADILPQVFDISTCYGNRDKTQFAVSFQYTGGVGKCIKYSFCLMIWLMII